MSTKKIAALTFLSAFLCACGGGGGGGGSGASGSTPVSTQIIAVLNQSVAASQRGISIQTLDAVDGTGTADGAIRIATPHMHFAGGNVYLDELMGASLASYRTASDDIDYHRSLLHKETTRAYYLKSAPHLLTAALFLDSSAPDAMGKITFSQQDILAVGGQKSNLKYADFGYWYSAMVFDSLRDNNGEIIPGVTEYFEGNKYYDWDIFVVTADPANKLTNITQNLEDISYSGSTLGVASAMPTGGGPALRATPVEGDFSLTFNAGDTFTANLQLGLYDASANEVYQWADYKFTGNVNKTAGEFSSNGLVRSLSISSGSNITSRYQLGELNGASGLTGNMLGVGADNVEEVAGNYTIKNDAKGGNDYYVQVDGAFGAAKQ